MPKAKANRSKPKTIRCPRCGKKFCSETNVLQHMNQPAGLCHAALWYDDNALYRPPQDPPQDPSLHPDPYADENEIDSNHHSPLSPSHSIPFADEIDYSYSPSPPSDMGHEALDDGSVPMEIDSDPGQPFTDAYPGCARSFPGGSTFMDRFWEDTYSKERRENLYYPFASREEWQFSSWCIRSGLSVTALNSLFSLDIIDLNKIQRLSLSFRTARDLKARVECLPSGPAWLCEQIKPDYPTKRPVRLFFRPPLDCLQALLSHPLLAPHITFIPRKVWTLAARICRLYEDWLSGDRAWTIQDSLPEGATMLGVILSSDKTNISVMSGNRMAYPLLISLANISPEIRSKISMHTYLLLALLPIPKFLHRDTRVRSLLHDRLFHQALNKVLDPLKTAARVGYMMSDPVGNLRYCFTPIAAHIADTPELCLMAGIGPKASPFTVAISKNFGDPYLHPPRTGSHTVSAIRKVLRKHSAQDYKPFLKACKTLQLNGVVDLCWLGWPNACPSEFLHIETLHHFLRFSFDHDVKWCIEVATAPEIDFRFSLIQPMVGYRGFEDGISKLKQVTGHDHRAIQRYIVGVISGAVPRRFLVAIRALVDFRYLAQAPVFSDQSLEQLASTLQLFHENKEAVAQEGVRRTWEIPKLELLQSVVSNIRRSGAVIQWSADATEHAHVQEVKVPARLSNNQNYYDQIARHLDRSDKCFRFDIATYFETRSNPGFDYDEEQDEEHDLEGDTASYTLRDPMKLPRMPINYFIIADALAAGSVPNALKPHRTFSTSTTAFHLANRPSLRMTVDEAAVLFGLPDLRAAIGQFLQRVRDHSDHPVSGVTAQDAGYPLPFDHIQIWHKLRVQQPLYHQRRSTDSPQTLRAFPPSGDHPHGLCDAAIVSSGTDSDWPRRGIEGHTVAQLRLIFRPLGTDYFIAYVQRFNVVPQQGTSGEVHPTTGMHLLRRATKSGGVRIGNVIPVSHIRSQAHLIPNFGKEANPRLTRESSVELSSDFWLNKYWSKESYYALSPL